MKVLGVSERNRYIVDVSHDELEKVSGNYYGKLKTLEVGSVMDLALGYKFTDDIQRACKQMTEAMTAFERAQNTMNSFALMIAALPREEPTAE